jgi:PAS domain S-box-containing protein
MKAGRNIASEKDLERFRQRATELEMENEQLKKNLQQKQEPFYKIFQASSNPMAITTVKEGRIIDLNEAYARFTGYRREELVGQTTIEHGIWTDSKQRDKVVQKLQEEGNVNNLEVGVRTKRGDIRTVLFSVSEISLGNGSYLLSTAIDITDRKNAEEKLRESEEKYRTLVEQSLQGLAIMQNSSFVFCNNRFAEISGYSVEELLSLSFDEITAMINPDDRGFIEDRHRDRMAGRPVSSHYEYQGIKKDGTEFWLEIYSSLIEYNGRPAIQSAFMDITERKQIAEALQQAEEKYRSIYEGALEGMFRSTPNGRFLIVNPALAKMLGFSNSEEVITTIKDIGRQIFAKPERRKEFLNELKKNDMVRGFEFKALRKDGSKIWLSIFAHSVRDSAGRLLYYDGYVEDISERKQAENERRESEERFRLIAETIDEIFWIFDLENNIPTYISPAHERIYGYSRDGSYSMRETFLDPVHPEDRERVVATISQMKNGQVLDYEHRIIRPDGSIRHIWNRCYPIPDETGRIKRYVGIGQDVTAWRHAEAALREKKDYLNEIINCIADPVFVKDRQLRFELVNDAMCAFSGRSRDQMLGLKAVRSVSSRKRSTLRKTISERSWSGRHC